MADYKSTAIVEFQVNGAPAKARLKELEEELVTLRKRLDDAAKRGDKVEMKRLARDIRATEREIKKMTSDIMETERVLRNLDKATPQELRKTLRELTRELAKIERGSAAWDAHVAKIQQVKGALAEVTAELEPQESLVGRLKGAWQRVQLGVAGAVATLTAFAVAGRKAVNDYAGMEQEMASVRKYTGMSAEEVERLNDELKKIDTRTSREELNKLAQEAGRLGRSSLEDVLGFVRAADQINVALDDLGEGATLTLSKLTTIFGDEARLGTERSLLAVGSVINELSQSCTASAPYLAEFASRMGGVGAQAGMTVQQIMGLGAVLDASNQQVEAASTAIAQVLTRMYTDPAKYAKVAGLEVQEFADLLKHDANEALITFLSALNQAGGMDALAPMFKDMGETGARAVSALSTLAGKIDMVREMQLQANAAYEDATSVTKEFVVQNNTVQASLEKAQANLHELSVELGKKLTPIMRYALSSAAATAKALSILVDYIIANRTELLIVTTALAAYTVAIKIHSSWTAILTMRTKLWHAAIATGSKLLPVWNLAVAAATNAVQYFTNGMQVSYAMQQRWQRAVKAMSFGNWAALTVAAIAAVVAIIVKLRHKTQEVSTETRTLANIQSEAAKKSWERINSINLLVAAANNELLSLQERKKACIELNRIIPGYCAQIDATTGKYRASKVALDEYLASLQRKYELEGAGEMLKNLNAQKAQLDVEYSVQLEKVFNENRDAILFKHNSEWIQEEARKRAEEKVGASRADIDKKISIINKTYGQDLQKKAVEEGAGENQRTPEPEPQKQPSGSGGDKFASVKQWRDAEEARIRIARATGKTINEEGQEQVYTYEDYEEDKLRLALEYAERRKEVAGVTADELTQIEADRAEAQRAIEDRHNAAYLEAEEECYQESLAKAKQNYIDGKYSYETYTEAIYRAEADHLRRTAELKGRDTEEGEAAWAKYQDYILAEALKRQKKVEDAERRHAEEVERIRKERIGMSPTEKEAEKGKEQLALQEARDKALEMAGDDSDEITRILEAYMQGLDEIEAKFGEVSEEGEAGLKGAIGKSAEWLKGPGGQALQQGLSTVVSAMSGIMSQLTALTQAEMEMQVAAVEQRYDAEIEEAEGNSFKVAKLEDEKETEVARIKNEANKKMYTMKVIDAVAQTAVSALNAYSSAAAVPVIGYILAPIAAAAAVAAGMLQVAAIKKQQQAAEAQGYSEGGYTPDGDKDKPVGVVHAGEWVASQKLVRSPQVRPILDALEYAQRNNTISSLTPQAASYLMPPSAGITSTAGAAVTSASRSSAGSGASGESDSGLTDAVRLLRQRLDEPIRASVGITGDDGYDKARSMYDKLIANKSPKTSR